MGCGFSGRGYDGEGMEGEGRTREKAAGLPVRGWGRAGDSGIGGEDTAAAGFDMVRGNRAPAKFCGTPELAGRNVYRGAVPASNDLG